MLSRKTQFSVGDAKKYFREDLCVGGHCTGGQQAPGRWFGKGAEDLGLPGLTHGEELVRLCENIHPLTGERLTLRQRKELSFLAALTSSQRSLVADGQPLIAEITATEMQPSVKVA
ncbi:MAG TPA: relaxase domain-containing protein [Bradyrhizobium sp.]|nr:relaxase domain-containing protein [Bradyrhizobium sp.]